MKKPSPDLGLQTDLFAEPAPARATGLVASLSRNKPADKAQARLHTLIKQIEGMRREVEAWREGIPRYLQRIDNELKPLEAEVERTHCQVAFVLETALQTKGMLTGKVQRRKVTEAILEICADHLLNANEVNPDIRALHDRYSQHSYAEIEAEQQAVESQLMAALFGGEPEDYADQTIAEVMAEQMAGSRSQAEEPAPHRGRKPAREKAPSKAEQAQVEASQTVRTVFRKLASALHPDRESDPAERERKTALMQRVNDAYAKGDLLQLLNLQLEIEQIDTEHLAQLSEQQRKHYQALFNHQLKELKSELEHLTAPFRALMNRHYGKLLPAEVDRSISAELCNMQAELARLQAQVSDFADKDKLRAFFRKY